MQQNPSLIDLKALAEPATKLIDRVSDFVEGVFRPQQIKRVAKANAEAKLVQAKTNIKISKLEQRTLKRMLKEEVFNQQNMENVTIKAFPYLSNGAIPESISDDWLRQFYNKSKLISDNDVQEIWAKVLAGEANSAGSYSLRTLDILSTMDKRDAEAFVNLCNFICFISGKTVPIIFDPAEVIYKSNGITYEVLTHLESIGLIKFNSPIGFSITSQNIQEVEINYFGNRSRVSLPLIDGMYKLDTGVVLLTSSGLDLYKLSTTHMINDFPKYLESKLSSKIK